MPRALSINLRVRVLAAVARGLSHRGAGERFGISAAPSLRKGKDKLFRPSTGGVQLHRSRRASLRQCNVSVSGQRELKDGAAGRIGARP